ncbi:hypothetical protein BGS_0709 [Beggiatoa sp. SS]|nr:hypothetical protein BGS_0709 [Beggiatoa sp. SS]
MFIKPTGLNKKWPPGGFNVGIGLLPFWPFPHKGFFQWIWPANGGCFTGNRLEQLLVQGTDCTGCHDKPAASGSACDLIRTWELA